MRAIAALTRDHERIKVVLKLIEQSMRDLEVAPRPDGPRWLDLLALCEHWVDRAHRLKEEQALFPLLRSRGLGPEITVVAALLAQHQTAEAFLRELRRAVERLAAGQPDARGDVLVWARDYVELLREHMRIEDNYFYGLADGSLSAGDDTALIEKFDRIDRGLDLSHEQQQRWEALLAEARPDNPVH